MSVSPIGLYETIPQMNNFVIYKGFFDQGVNAPLQDSADSETKVTARYILLSYHVGFRTKCQII